MKSLAILILALGLSVAEAENWTTTGGKTYHAVFIVKTMPSAVIISSVEGTALVHFTELPPDLQKRFGYDAAAVAAAETKKKADAEAALRAPLNYTDIVSLLGRVGNGKYDRFKDYYTYDMNSFPLEGKNGVYKAWLTVFSAGDHLCTEPKVTMYIERVGSDWLWLEGHDVTMLAGANRFVPTDTEIYTHVVDGSDGDCLEIVNFDIPVDSLGRMSNTLDWAVQVGDTELDLHAASVSEAGAVLVELLHGLPKEGDPVPAPQLHTARYYSIETSQPEPAEATASDNAPMAPTETSAPPAATFNPGSIDAPVTGP